jgi:hypothetical protein
MAALAEKPTRDNRMRRSLAVLAVLPFALGLGGCIDSSIDLSASLPPAFPLAEGFYKAMNDPKSPAFKIVKSGADYRAIDPAEPNGKGAVFAVMDPERNGVYLAEDKTGANDAKQPHYAYYFLRVDAAGDTVDLYDFTKADWSRLPADLKKRLVPGVGLSLVDVSDTAAVLREIDRRLSVRPTLKKTTFELTRKLDGG